MIPPKFRFLGSLAALPLLLNGSRVGPVAEAPSTVSSVPALVSVMFQGGETPHKAARRFERGPDFVFTRDARAKITRTRVNRPGSGVGTVSPDGSTYFMDAAHNGMYGGVLISKKYPLGVYYDTPEVNDFAFSPSGKYVAAYDDIEHSVAVLAVPQGKLVRKFRDAYAMRFRADGMFLYRNKCQLYEVDPSTTTEPRPIGPNLCGGAHASANGHVWIVVEPTEYPYIRSGMRFTRLTVIDGTTGKATPIPVGLPFLQASVSAAGKRVCYWLDWRLYCRELSTGQLDTFDSIKIGALRWEQDDNLMLAPTDKEFMLASFAQHTIRKVATAEDTRSFGFLPGGRRLYLYQKGANLYDLDSGLSFEIFDKKVEVVGFATVPNRVDRFLSGKFTAGKRDPHWIDVKRSPSPPAAKLATPAATVPATLAAPAAAAARPSSKSKAAKTP